MAELSGEGATKQGYIIAIVLDDAAANLDSAERQLVHLWDQLWPAPLTGFDLYYNHPATLMGCLCFNTGGFADAVGPVLAGAVKEQKAKWRVLDLMALSESERQQFLDHYPKRFAVRYEGIKDLRAVLSELRKQVTPSKGGSERRRAKRVQASLPVNFVSGKEIHAALASNVSTSGIYIESDNLLEVGEIIPVAISTQSGQGPIELTGKVVYVNDQEPAREGDRNPGFAVEFIMSGEQAALFDSFLVAATRGTSWPERSGRRYERFPVYIRVDYDLDGEHRRERTLNISRGGMYIESISPPDKGMALDFSLFAPGSFDKVAMSGHVVHRVTVEEALSTPKITAGFGVAFDDPAEELDDKIQALLSGVSVPATRRAMVVDDDRFFRVVLGNVLKLAGFEVLEASSSEEAFLLLIEELLRLDVLIVDYYMPGMSGSALVDKVRRVGGEVDLAIVMMTGANLDQEARNKLNGLGVDDIIAKNIPPEEVLDRVERCLVAKPTPPVSKDDT